MLPATCRRENIVDTGHRAVCPADVWIIHLLFMAGLLVQLLLALGAQGEWPCENAKSLRKSGFGYF